ncbi:hypothetical protein EOE18_13655 [Novosphingobium umbonatum]|uniref:Uncharacterized protein n=1 Tax=Novosphingobium umbonatum TaxID=1908524 RepID=A0A437N1V5_9SPHN|nr:hypothetical protein [Novosphingobium umbonatum]RVU03900.1 hypothetical protein EOE18_13655 [Novosphingobium umbonatum]
MSTLALTSCWFTRHHAPLMMPKARVDDSFYAQCRHCKRPIFSMDGKQWHIDGGFNAETLGDAATSFLSIVDDLDAVIVARVPVPLSASEEDVEALKLKLREQYGLDEPGNTLSLRDNRRAVQLHQLHKHARAHGRAAAVPVAGIAPMPVPPAAGLPDLPQANA